LLAEKLSITITIFYFLPRPKQC